LDNICASAPCIRNDVVSQRNANGVNATSKATSEIQQLRGRDMRILIAPDKFKGSLTASEAASAIAEGVRRVTQRLRSLSFQSPTAVRVR
jgi:hypothetical protein